VTSDTPLVADFDSSAVERARYSPQAGTLDIWYKGGDRYTYYDVPPDVYGALRQAESAGEYVNREIKPRFRCEIEESRRRFRPD
jgi:hypothetical protein